jgi:hypothetical protein
MKSFGILGGGLKLRAVSFAVRQDGWDMEMVSTNGCVDTQGGS